MAGKKGNARYVGEIYINFANPEGYIRFDSDVTVEDVAAAMELLAKKMRETVKYCVRNNFWISYVDLDEGKYSAGEERYG